MASVSKSLSKQPARKSAAAKLANGLRRNALPYLFLFPLVAILIAFLAICMASFVKDFAMAASWSTTIDIGHRYSGTVAGLMNTVGNLGTVFSPPIVTALVLLAGGEEMKWDVSLYYYATMFFIASVLWFFINPRRVIVYAPEDRARLQMAGAIE